MLVLGLQLEEVLEWANALLILGWWALANSPISGSKYPHLLEAFQVLMQATCMASILLQVFEEDGNYVALPSGGGARCSVAALGRAPRPLGTAANECATVPTRHSSARSSILRNHDRSAREDVDSPYPSTLWQPQEHWPWFL